MTWVAVAIAGSAVIGGVVSSRNASKAADAASGAGAASSGYYNQLAEISKEEYDVWRAEGLPMLRELAGFRRSDIAEETGQAADTVRTQHALGRERAQRALGAFRNPGDPGYADILADTYGAEASDVAGAIINTRRNALDRDYNRTTNLVNMYRGFAGQGMTGLNAAAGGQRGVGVLQGNLANMYGNFGAQAGYAAGRAFSAIPPGTFGGGNDGVTGEPFTGQGPVDSFYPQGTDFGGMRDGGKIIDVDYAEGGKIKGPGTGTSDSVSAIKRPGTYILSADTVRALGTKKVDKFMEDAGVRPGHGGESDRGGVPVRLSNGEYALPPEVTSYFGEDFFNKLQQKYHRPVLSDEGGAANGGAIRRRVLPRRVEEAIFRSMPDNALMRR